MVSEKVEIEKFASYIRLEESGFVPDIVIGKITLPLKIIWAKEMFSCMVSIENHTVLLFGKVSSLEKLKELAKVGVRAEVYGKYVKIGDTKLDDVESSEGWEKELNWWN